MSDGLRPGEVFAGYTIEAMIGEGGMGRVYRARHPRLPRAVALKMLTPVHNTDSTFAARFEREADHAARVEHPNVVTVYDRGLDDGRPWISMQYISGRDASATVTAEGPLPVDRAVYIVSEIARGLDHAHALGVLHRDVKPANIMLSPNPHGPERVLLADFGIAKTLAEETGLTETGTIVSSLPFAAPEVLYGRTLDGRTDQYALAATLYTLLAGSPPFPGPNQAEIVAGHLSASVPLLAGRRRDVPPALDAVIARGMAKDPADRFPTCSGFAAAARDALRLAASHVRDAPAGDAPFRPTEVAPHPHPQDPRSQPSGSWSQPSGSWSQPSGSWSQPSGSWSQQQGGRPPQPQGPWPQQQGGRAEPSGPWSQPRGTDGRLITGAVPFVEGSAPTGPPPHYRPPHTSAPAQHPPGHSGAPQPTREWTDPRAPRLGPEHTAMPAPAAPPSRSSNRTMVIGLAVAAVALVTAAAITAVLVLRGDSGGQAAGGAAATTTVASTGGASATTSGAATGTASAEEAVWTAASETRQEFADILPAAPLAVGYMNMTCVATDTADGPVYAQFESKFDCAARGGADFELFTYSDPSGVEQYVTNLPTGLPIPYSHVSERGTRMNMYRFESPEGNWVLVLFDDAPYRDNLIQFEIADVPFATMIDWLVEAPL